MSWSSLKVYFVGWKAMHLEFQYILEELSGQKGVVVMDAPEEILADVASPLCFSLSSRSGPPFLSDSSVRDSPKAWAALLIERYNQSKNDLFVLSGEGYINASLTSAGEKKFFERLCEVGFSRLLRPTSIFNTISGEVVRIEISETWLVEQARLKSGDVERDRIPSCPSLEDSLQLLWFLARPEIDLMSYFRGLCGKENFPWLLNRFQTETRAAQNLIEPHVLAGYLLQSSSLLNLRSQLLRFRSFWLAKQPAIQLLEVTTSLIAEYFRFTRHPSFKDSFPESPAHTPFQALSCELSSLVKEVMACVSVTKS